MAPEPLIPAINRDNPGAVSDQGRAAFIGGLDAGHERGQRGTPGNAGQDRQPVLAELPETRARQPGPSGPTSCALKVSICSPLR
jgi:hypothetical protein